MMLIIISKVHSNLLRGGVCDAEFGLKVMILSFRKGVSAVHGTDEYTELDGRGNGDGVEFAVTE
jgi:hypothetical protein